MGRNISIYLTDDALKWLDHLSKVWGKKGRSATIQFMLDSMKRQVLALLPEIAKDSPKGVSELAKILFEEAKKTE